MSRRKFVATIEFHLDSDSEFLDRFGLEQKIAKAPFVDVKMCACIGEQPVPKIQRPSKINV